MGPGILNERRTVFKCGKTGIQELRQCSNDVNRYSYLATVLIQFIFCVYRDMWEEQVKMYLCACYLYACVFVGVYCCDKTNALWFKGEEKTQHLCSIISESISSTIL